VTTVFGVMFNYKSTGTLVFRSRGNHRLRRFIAVYVVVYIVNVSALSAMLGVGIPEWLGGLILLLPSAILSYVLNRQFVFPP
jgi:putative flippase GtrA